MSQENENGPKVHYICQTYIEKKTGRDGQVSLSIDKQIKYSTSHEAQLRAEREHLSDSCVGVDAYSVTEDPDSGEVSDPSFIVRLGSVPEVEPS
ncbi:MULTISPECIES: hypothetical protein [unclassified Sulfitobacter]|jgi:hypothetical protein|uniref:hypothetical protein n=1 Tax=unclassified Sulfitobacter TaxID=196795 RepID=UPI001593F318|nr:hypothetical protein [Sulfitobacter sp. HGT1]